ncbi:spore germination protein [Paenibacillus sp.]|uniref:spore germination protein n=1 Tax=Paenibacillus sp. TaxID=58172 RepID=UPI002D47C7F7|nr:spore germination protein [Paenibacillus sp.]HZG58815.1 spore germination protein [Paenibacillus sp.]
MNETGNPLYRDESDEERSTPVGERAEQNAGALKTRFGRTDDLGERSVPIAGGSRTAIVFYFDSLVDKAVVDQFVIAKLQTMTERSWDAPAAELSTHGLFSAQTIEEASKRLLAGGTVVFVDGLREAWIASTDGGQRRSVTEPSSEAVVRGPREAFNESLLTNMGLLRRRLYTPRLRFENVLVGSVSRTPLSIVYIDGLAKADILEEVRSRIGKIDIDGVVESQVIEEFIEDPVYSPFPTVFNTERPDRVAAALLEGRIAILTDGTPVALVVPATITMFLYSNEDYYQRFDIASLLKTLRTVTFFISFLLPSFYVALLTFHQEMIPTTLLIALTGQREGVPFGIATEVLLMELTFEVLREAGIRLPKTIGSAVSIVGGLVLGQAAVEASLIGPGTVIAVSATAIASFTTPSYGFAIASRMLRFAMLFLTAFIGSFGFFFGLIFIIVHLNTLRSFGVPYMSPIAPFHRKSWRDLLVRVPWWAMQYRPAEVTADRKRFARPQKWNRSDGGEGG